MDPVVDFSLHDLSNITTEKLIKMRDVVADRYKELQVETRDTESRLADIFSELSSRERFNNPE